MKIQFINIFFIFVIIISCSKVINQSDSTRVVLSFKNSDNYLISLNGLSTDTNQLFSISNRTFNYFDQMIKNGEWSFYTIVYKKNNNGLEVKGCDYIENKKLDGTPLLLVLRPDISKCSNLETFTKVSFITCSSFDNLDLNSTNCDDNIGNIQSLKVELLSAYYPIDYNTQNLVFPDLDLENPNEVICYNFEESSSILNSEIFLPTPLERPLNVLPFFLKITSYSNQDCISDNKLRTYLYNYENFYTNDYTQTKIIRNQIRVNSSRSNFTEDRFGLFISN